MPVSFLWLQQACCASACAWPGEALDQDSLTLIIHQPAKGLSQAEVSLPAGKISGGISVALKAVFEAVRCWDALSFGDVARLLRERNAF